MPILTQNQKERWIKGIVPVGTIILFLLIVGLIANYVAIPFVGKLDAEKKSNAKKEEATYFTPFFHAPITKGNTSYLEFVEKKYLRLRGPGTEGRMYQMLVAEEKFEKANPNIHVITWDTYSEMPDGNKFSGYHGIIIHHEPKKR